MRNQHACRPVDSTVAIRGYRNTRAILQLMRSSEYMLSVRSHRQCQESPAGRPFHMPEASLHSSARKYSVPWMPSAKLRSIVLLMSGANYFVCVRARMHVWEWPRAARGWGPRRGSSGRASTGLKMTPYREHLCSPPCNITLAGNAFVRTASWRIVENPVIQVVHQLMVLMQTS